MKAFISFLFVFISIAVLSQNSQTPTNPATRRNPWAATQYPNAKVTFTNPVIPGFNSDPSVCRVGDDYYSISSTFEYFPGVPVFHSKDLVNWQLIGYCINRREQLPQGMNIFAATIRYHDGVFYMVTTNMGGKGGNFYVTATDPAGPWSDPIWVTAGGIDPDLFWDDDGKAYIITSTMVLYEIDIKTGKLLTEGVKVWNGTGGRYAEGPHIYKKDGWYYLMGAEGGTEEAHSETIARSHSIWGPYTDNPANPILAHANAAGQGNPIQGVGHADIIQAHDGSWWIIFHGYRTIGSGVHHILGRETCLAPVSWPENGWPVVNGNGTATVNMTCPTLPLKPFPAQPLRYDFNTASMDLEWNYVQVPDYSKYSLEERKGFLRLKGASSAIGGQGSPTFTGIRVRDMYFSATTRLDFNPTGNNEEAGMILLNNGSHFDIMVIRENNKRYLVVKLEFGSTIYTSEKALLKSGPVNLKVSCNKTQFTFSWSQGNDSFKQVEVADAKFLSSETVGGFTGLYVGLYATGNGNASSANADYEYFEYAKEEAPPASQQRAPMF